MDSTNIPTGLKITSQIPLDIKGNIINEATLAYLGVNNNLAFTYHDQLIVTCLEEGTRYIWREVKIGEENTGLVSLDFIYPNSITAYGITYSNKKFNFFLLPSLESNYTVNNVGTGVGLYKNTTVLNDTKTFNLKTLKSSSVGLGTSVVKDIDTTNPDEINLRFKTLKSSNILVKENIDGSLELTAPDNSPFQYLLAYYINYNYSSTSTSPSDGSIIRPFVNFDEARAKMIGTGTILNPQYPNATFIMQTSSTTALNPTINTLRIVFEKGTTLTYTGNDPYVFDTEVLYPLVIKDGLNEITQSINLEIGGVGGISRTTPGGYIRSVGAKRGSSTTTNNLNTINIRINRTDEDRISLVEYQGYNSSIYGGDVLASDGVTLVGNTYNPTRSLKWTTQLNPTFPLVYASGNSFVGFSYPIYGAGTLFIATLVNTALHVENTNIAFNKLIVDSTDDLISVVQGSTFVPGFPGVYELKNAPAIHMENVEGFINTVEYINGGTFGFHGWDKFFNIKGSFNLRGTINYDTNYYIKTFAHFEDTVQDYFKFNGKTKSGNLNSRINYLINSPRTGNFYLYMQNTAITNVLNISKNPSTTIIPITEGTIASINAIPYLSGINNYTNDAAATATGLLQNALYFNTTINALDKI